MAKHKEPETTEPEIIEPDSDEETKPDELGDEPQATVDEDNSEETEEDDEEPRGPNILQRFFAKYKAKKKIAIPLTILLALFIVFAVPASRYKVLGLVIKKNFAVVVIDSKTNVPISGVELNLVGKTAKTDGEGRATLKDIKVGHAELRATKTYYKDQNTPVIVTLNNQREPQEVKIEATGRQVPVHIINKITGDNLGKATLKASGTEAQTDSNGETTIVLPPDQPKIKGEITLNGYNSLTVDITVEERSVAENTFKLVPSGKIYFLSKRTGKIDVMKSNLDGSDAKVVLKATGKEQEQDTLLVATRDWKYLALKSRREGEQPRLYVIDTSNDKFSEVDGGNEAEIDLSGWSGHNFIYSVERTNVKAWHAKKQALKAYNAESGNISVIDETAAAGSGIKDYAKEIINDIKILGDRVVYIKYWETSYVADYRLANKRNGIYEVYANGTNKKLLKDFPAKYSFNYAQIIQSEPYELYIRDPNIPGRNYTYESGSFKEDPEVKEEDFDRGYPIFILSPSADRTFWFEERDGKNTLFVGDRGGNKPQEITSTSEYTPYGWFTEDYVLVSKENSELYIMAAKGTGAKGEIVKITNYHRPRYFLAYGGGY